MLYCNRIDISEGVDLAESDNSKEFMICHCWFFNHGFKFQDYVCNGCHDLTMLSVNISDLAIITIKKYWLRFQSTHDRFVCFLLFCLVDIKWLIV